MLVLYIFALFLFLPKFCLLVWTQSHFFFEQVTLIIGHPIFSQSQKHILTARPLCFNTLCHWHALLLVLIFLKQWYWGAQTCHSPTCRGLSKYNSQHTHLHWSYAEGFLRVKLKISSWDFPGGPVVKNTPANAGDTSLTPGLGRFHVHEAAKAMRHSCWTCALGLGATTSKPERQLLKPVV